MAERIELHQKLKDILGKPNVYFQPPEDAKLSYPCIVYNKSTPSLKYADSKVYNYTECYDILVIYKDPDSDLVKRMILYFPMIRHVTHFISDNLIHDKLTLYY